MPQSQPFVVLGVIGKPYGIKGWVSIHSDTEPPENIWNYHPWYLRRRNDPGAAWEVTEVIETRRHGKSIIALLQGCEDRTQAQGMTGFEIGIPREQLPQLPQGEYYWIDLIGLQVRGVDGHDFGRIRRMLDTGANDVMVVQGTGEETLIPYIKGDVVLDIDLENNTMTVDWDKDF